MYSIGDHVWVESGTKNEFNIPRGAKIIEIDNKQVQIQFEDDLVEWVTQKNILRTMDASTVEPVNDMIHMGDLQEYTILRNLELRYSKNLIYTYIGDMLVAVNPYRLLNIYSANEVSTYSKGESSLLPAHIFATSYGCFRAMKNTRKDQCILISGESGAGKTESAKLILQYLTTISADGDHSWIKQQILETNPILEAFGNAKTQRNENSSRFGKYINIYFNDKSEIKGAQIDYYLLEKSRVITQSNHERNYHIFYALLAGLSEEEKNELSLKSEAHYNYLQKSVMSSDGSNDAKTFADIQAAMKVLNHDEILFKNIIKLFAMILHLGNLEYTEVEIAHNDAVEINDRPCFKKISELLGVNENSATEFLTKKQIFARGEKIVSNLSKSQAIEVRDAFAKLIFEKTFAKIIKEINSTLSTSKEHVKSTIGILDISGFENFDTNSFEQLCINYANERLQQLFVQHVFKIEQEIYVSESISWTNVEFIDNRDIINLIGLAPTSIMSLVDDESIFPQGSDTTMLRKIFATHRKNKILTKPKNDLSEGFGICHFAGLVYYEAQGFLDKNRDVCSGNVEDLVAASTNGFLKELFPRGDVKRNSDVKKRLDTLSIKFRDSLESLLSTLQKCNPRYVKCIKPNNHRSPKVFDRTLCARQLRYLGLTETARIRQAGYAVRYDYTDFVEKFHILGREIENEKDPRRIAEKICENVLEKPQLNYQLGNTRVFLKDYQNAILEEKKNNALKKYAVIIQKNFRMWIQRKRYLKIKKAAIVLQRFWRGFCVRKQMRKFREAVLRLQSRIKSRLLAAEFQKRRKIIISLQAMCRRHLAQKVYKEKKKQLRREKLNVNKNKVKNGVHRMSNSRQLHKDSEKIETMFEFLVSEQKNDHTKQNRESFTSFSSIKLEPTSHDIHKFASVYFVGNTTLQFSKHPLKQSLLDLPHPSDELAATALSVTILRYMSDLPKPEFSDINRKNGSISSSSSDFSSKNDSHHDRMLLRKKNKLSKKIIKVIMSSDYKFWLIGQKTNDEKLHFIVGHGILRPQLRDEIYCQIVKQLTDNPSKESLNIGWELLSFCLGCFGPSQKLYPYLKSYLKSNNRDFCQRRLERTYENGSRTQPPCREEIKAVRKKEPILLEVILTDYTVKKIKADSATTANEVVEELSRSIKLEDTFGFSLFIKIGNQVLSLGSEKDHVMDAISQCEQYARDHYDDKASWKIFLKKEIFSPWNHTISDRTAVELIYHQIIKGIAIGEYDLHDENNLAAIIARQLMIQYHSKTLPKNLKSILGMYVPYELLQKNVLQTNLEKTILRNYKMLVQSNVYGDLKIKEDIVRIAKDSWPLSFSKFYEATKVFGPRSVANDVIIAVNSTGISFMDTDENHLLEISFPEISEITFEKDEDLSFNNFKISTFQAVFTFQSNQAQSFVSFVNYILCELKSKSGYVLALKDYSNDDDVLSKFSLKKGDFIKLSDEFNGDTIMTSSWARGICNGLEGEFPTECVYVLPTLNQPSQELIEIFRANLVPEFSKQTKLHQELIEKLREMKFYNLKKFAKEHFRKSMKIKNRSEELWKHTRKPIQAPLLAKLSGKVEECKQAVKIFCCILEYMEDLQSNQERVGTELTDEIFGPTLNNDLLRDEIYCQIMRQLTRNKNHASENFGWELMWLATGIITCGPVVRKELESFLNSREHILSKESLNRLNRTEKLSETRTEPPYILEVETIKLKNSQIFHKIYFPDGTDSAFEVHSTTRVDDLCRVITKQLEVSDPNGFSLYFKIEDRVIPVTKKSFFFDSIRQIMGLITRCKGRRPEEYYDIKYELLFMRKIWINCWPGHDKVADVKFHFHQELAKYMRGYHNCSKKEAAQLAHLIHRSKHGSCSQELNSISSKLQDYVPIDMIDQMSPSEWKKQIAVLAYFLPSSNISKDEAKELFLRHVYQWPYFGAVFFNVNQTTEPEFPNRVLMAIDKSGLSIVDPKSKDVLALYSFDDIVTWNFNDSSFHLTIKNLVKPKKILCETMNGYEMNDLMSSYINFLSNQK